MINGIPKIAMPPNEPIRSYAPGTNEREALKKELLRLSGRKFDIPCHTCRGRRAQPYS